MRLKISKEEAKVLIAYLAVCILWGSTYLAIRIGVSEMPPELFAGMRFLLVGVILLSFAYLRGLKFPDNSKEVWKHSIVGLLLLLGGNGLVAWTEQWVSSGIASLLLASVPLFMAIIELVSPYRIKIDYKGWLGLLVGFAGVAMLVFSNQATGFVDIKGGILLLIGSFSWALGSVYSKSIKNTASMIVIIGIQSLAGGIGLSVIGAAMGELGRIHFTSRGIGAMAYLIIFGSILGYSSYIYILQKWPAAKAGTYAYVNPPVAVFLGFLVLGETVNSSIILSTLVILAGVMLVQFSKTAASKPKTEDK